MHIAQSNLTLKATGASVADRRQSATLRIETRPQQRSADSPPKVDPPKVDTTEISPAAAERQRHADMLARFGPKLYLLALLVEHLTGQKIELIDPSELDSSASANQAQAAQQTLVRTPNQPQVAVELDAQSIRYESQTSTFAAQGTVTTDSGREIKIDMQATISREFLATDSLSVRARAAAAKDPLVLDLNGPTRLSTQRLAFDVNADGVAEQVAMPASDSTLLALDRNGNGKIDDGSELFGPQTGNGYSELSALDADANGWIDSSDPSFSQLRLWQPDTAGARSLQTLEQAGVAAIGLQNIATPFSFRDPTTNEELGTLNSSGLFLREDGSTGTVRDIDVSA